MKESSPKTFRVELIVRERPGCEPYDDFTHVGHVVSWLVGNHLDLDPISTTISLHQPETTR